MAPATDGADGGNGSTSVWDDDDVVEVPAEVGEEGGEVVDDYDPLIHDDPESPDYRGAKAGEGEEGKTSPRPRASTPAFGPEAVAAAVTAALKSSKSEDPKPAAFDKEAYRKAIGYRQITEADLATILDSDKPVAERAAALDALLEQREQSVTTVAKALFQQLGGQVEGVQSMIQEQQRQQHESKLLADTVKAYPALKEFGTLLPQLFAELRNSGQRPKTYDEGVRMLASFAQQKIRQYNKNFSLRNAAAPRQREMAGAVNTGGAQSAPSRSNKNLPSWRTVWE